MKKVKQLLGTLLVFTMLLGLMQPTGNLAFAKENNSDSVIVIDEEVSETTTTEAELSTLENSTIEYTPIEQPEGISVRAYAAEGTFPEGTELIVTEIRSEGDTSEQYTDVENALNETDTEYTDFIILDISFYHNGLEIEPEDGTVQVSIELNTEKLPENVDTESIVVQHFKETSDGYVIEEVADSKDVTEGTVEVSSEEQILIDFEVDSFSSYTITFTSGYDNTLKDYDGDAISLDAYNAMLAKISTTVERASNLNEAVVNLPITNWKRTDESKTGDNQ